MDHNHSAFQENLPAFALGALDPDEAAALEAHLTTCDTCRADLSAYQSISSGLLAALPARAPRRDLRRSLEKALPGREGRARPRFSWSLGQVVFAGLLAALVGLNLLTVSQVYSLRKEQAELLDQRTSEQTAIAMLAYPSTQPIAFEENGVTGSLLIDKQRNLVAVFAWNLAQPPAGKTYQMWLIDPKGDRTSGGFLVPEAGYPFVMAVVRSPQPLSGFTGFGITLEPSGGSPAPTGPKILHVDF